MSDTNIHIRTAEPEDADAIAEFNRAMAEETEQRRLDESILAAGVRGLLHNPTRGVYFMAQLGGRAVGQLLITYEWSDWRNGLFWWIQSVYVVPEMRRRGVYRALHEHVARNARQTQGVCGIRLYVDSDNRVAQDTYRRLGMSETGYLLFESDWSAAGQP